MAYIGNDLQVAFQNYKVIDDISASFNGVTTSFALTVNGITPVPFPLNEQNCIIIVGGVPQKPDYTGTEGFRFSGSNIVFSSAPTAGQKFWGVALAGADYVNAGVQYPDGSAGAPSITFGSNLTTGLYSAGTNVLGFTTAGIQRLQINGSGSLGLSGANYGTSGQVLTSAGSGAAPSWQLSAVYYNRRPPLYRGPLFYKTASTTISIVAGSVLNGQYYSTATAVSMPAHSDNTDYAIWQHPTTGALVGDASFTTAPAGATGGSIVGGYHYIPSGRPTAFNNGSPTASAEILEYSIWDLTWRPECPDPRGMACIDGRFWCDLYFCGATSYAGTDFTAVPSSRIGLTIADNSNPALIPSFYGGNGSTAYSLTGGNNPGSWYNFAEVAHSFGKRLMWSWEFQAAAFGAPEAGSRGSDPGTVIWERASKWGLAQATGTLLTWAIERVGIYTSGSNTNTGGRGTEYADAPRALLLGGYWNGGASSGSRYATWGYVPSRGDLDISARFAAGHLILG